MKVGTKCPVCGYNDFYPVQTRNILKCSRCDEKIRVSSKIYNICKQEYDHF